MSIPTFHRPVQLISDTKPTFRSTEVVEGEITHPVRVDDHRSQLIELHNIPLPDIHSMDLVLFPCLSLPASIAVAAAPKAELSIATG